MPLIAFWCLSDAALRVTSSGVIGFLLAGVLGAWPSPIPIVVGFGKLGVEGPVGKFGYGYLPEFP